MTENVSVTVYKTMVLSLFDYACFTHEGANTGLLKKLDRLQNRGLKICYRGKHMSEEEMYEKSSVPILRRRRQELLLSYMFKLSHNEAWVDDRVGRLGLRSQHKIKFRVPRARNCGYQKAPLYRRAELWDKLGDWYQSSKDKITFKRRISTLKDLDVINQNPHLAIDDSM